MLAETGANVRTAALGGRGHGRLSSDFHPDVLLCDIAMPGEDGYAFIRRMRAPGRRRAGATCPALALTALAGREDRGRALAAGFQLHMAKPVDIDRLAEAVVELSTGAKSVLPGESSGESQTN